MLWRVVFGSWYNDDGGLCETGQAAVGILLSAVWPEAGKQCAEAKWRKQVAW